MNEKQSIELRIQLLGAFRLSTGDYSVGDDKFRLRKARNFIKLLALAPNHRLHREQVIDWLWPDQDPTQAANNFYQALYAARKVLSTCGLPGPEILQLSEEVLNLCPNLNPWIDVEAFEDAAAQTRMNRIPAEFSTALDLYSGDLLPDDLYEEWTSERREALRRERMNLLLELADLYEADQENEKAITILQQAIEIDPLNEEAHARLMRLFALSGRRITALAQYETCRRSLEKELGIEPSPDTASLFERIRSGEVRGSQKADAPVPITPGPLRKPEMPTWLSPFIGRTNLLEKIQSILGEQKCRLLTLVGPGGSGKTRLAVEAASMQGKYYSDGVFFVPLAPLESSHSIHATIAKSLGLDFSEGSDTGQQSSNARQQVMDYLREKTVLLVMDNFEHLLEGAKLVVEILQSAPQVKVLVTSRVRLDVRGESLLPVPGMSYPIALPETAEVARQYSGVELFLETARRTNPTFEPDQAELVEIVKICQQIEGIPLAIMLAAPWVRILTPTEISAEIAASSLDFLQGQSKDAPERQRSMRSVFEPSWRLLGVRARQLFAGLCVFRGGFTLEAARQVCGATLRELAELVDQSMMERTSSGRYLIHELLRQYGEEKLADLAGDLDSNAARDRHAAYYISALRSWEMDYKGPRQLEVLLEVEREIADIDIAWGWACARGRLDWLAEGMMGLGNFYNILLRSQEGREAFERATAAVAARTDAYPQIYLGVQAVLLAWRARFDLVPANANLVRGLLQEAIHLLDEAERCGQDVRGYRAFTMFILGYLHRMVGDLQAEKAVRITSLALYRELGDRWGMILSLHILGSLLEKCGDLEESMRYLREGLALSEQLGVDLQMLNFKTRLAYTLSIIGKFDESESLLRECERQCRIQGNRRGLSRVLLILTMTQPYSGHFEQAVIAAEECVEIVLNLGGLASRPLIYLSEAYAALGQCEAARLTVQKYLMNFQNNFEAFWEKGVIKHILGIVAMLEGQWENAHQLLVESVALVRKSGYVKRLSAALADLSIAELKVGDEKAAHAYLGEALRLTVQGKGLVKIYYDLSSIAFYYANRDPELAVEFYALASRFPFAAKTAKFGLIGRRVTEATCKLAPEVVAAAERRGHERDFDAAIQELLVEFADKVPTPEGAPGPNSSG